MWAHKRYKPAPRLTAGDPVRGHGRHADGEMWTPLPAPAPVRRAAAVGPSVPGATHRVDDGGVGAGGGPLAAPDYEALRARLAQLFREGALC